MTKSKGKTAEDWEKYDEDRMHRAVKELGQSPNLRFLLRSLLSNCGCTGSVTGDTPHNMALLAGRQSVGNELIDTTIFYGPKFYSRLLGEAADEIIAKKNVTEEYKDG